MKTKQAIELRKTGISTLGEVPWGTHFCQFYESQQDLLDILIPYFRAGLENNEFCLWVVSDPLGEQEARNAFRQTVPEAALYLERGQIEILPDSDWYLNDGAFSAARILDSWSKRVVEAVTKGYAGLRASGNTAWLTRDNRKDFGEYERTLVEKLTDQRMIALCSYPLSKSHATDIFNVVNSHELAILRRNGNWEVLETAELIQAKREIKRLNQELEQRVVARTRELADANELLRREITDRKDAEQAVRRSEDYLRLVIDTIPTMAWTVQPDGALDFVNQRWLDYTGLSLKEAIEQPTRTVHPEDLPRALEKWAVVKATNNETYKDEMRLQRSDGDYRWFMVRIAPLLDEQGNLLKRYGVAVDIEQSKQAKDVSGDLTPRQYEVLRMIAEGYSTREIAAALEISIKTVETHRAHLMERLSIYDVAGLVRYAVKHGLVKTGG